MRKRTLRADGLEREKRTCLSFLSFYHICSIWNIFVFAEVTSGASSPVSVSDKAVTAATSTIMEALESFAIGIYDQLFTAVLQLVNRCVFSEESAS